MPTRVKPKSIREMGADEIRTRVTELREELFNLRFRNTMKQLDNPLKIRGLETFGIQVKERLPINVEASEHSASYLRTKFEKLGHLIE